jgi:hypothetical protein
MKPTNEELNRVAAEVCGWVYYSNVPGYSDGWRHEESDHAILLNYPYDKPLDYCTDRNALPELWRMVTDRTKQAAMIVCILQNIPVSAPPGINTQFWMMMTATPRTIVIAALKAIDKWPAEWEAGE